MPLTVLERDIAEKLFAKGLKRCGSCRKNKALDRFHTYRQARDGLSCYCKPCRLRIKRASDRRRIDQPDESARARFEAKIKRIRSGCWIWTASMNPDGHGMFVYQTRSIFAHVAACYIYGIKTPAGLCPYLKCGVPPCANPEHVGFCTRRELSLQHIRDNPFATNARQEWCTTRRHRFVDGVNIWWRITGTKGVQKAITRWCLDCWKEKFPGTSIRPNRREDAERVRDTKLLEFLGSHIPSSLRKEMRSEVLNDLFDLWRTRKVTRKSLPSAARKAVSRAWSFQPDRFRAPLSLDAPADGEGGETWLEKLPGELVTEQEAEDD